MPEDSPVTLAEGAGKLVSLLVGLVAAFCLYASVVHNLLGAQIAIAIGYTVAVVLFVFFRWRGLPEYFSFSDKRVLHQLPRLAVIHLAFLTVLLAALSVWESMRSRLPSSWLVESGPKLDSYYSWVLILFCAPTFFTQVLISRGILKRAISLEKQG